MSPETRCSAASPPVGEVSAWHGDVLRSPDGAHACASSALTDKPGFRFGQRLCVLFHPEADFAPRRGLAATPGVYRLAGQASLGDEEVGRLPEARRSVEPPSGASALRRLLSLHALVADPSTEES